MRICVTGSAGFLGSYVAQRFSAAGHEIVGVDNLSGGYLSNWPATIQGDCCDVGLMKSLCRGADVIYHCACSPYEGLSVFSPTLVTQSVLTATASMVAAAAHNHVRRFVYCSSMARYGRVGVPFTENVFPHPEDPYGIAKVAAEELIARMAKAHDFEYVIAVPHNIYGPGQKYNDPFRNVAAIMANLLLQYRQPVIYGDGKQTRCFSYIDDVMNVLTQLATAEGVSGHIFNVGPDEDEIEINELYRNLQRVTGIWRPARYFPDRPCEVKHAVCSSDKIRKWFNYKTRTSLNKGLQALVEWIRARGPKEFEYHLPLEIPEGKQIPRTWKERLF